MAKSPSENINAIISHYIELAKNHLNQLFSDTDNLPQSETQAYADQGQEFIKKVRETNDVIFKSYVPNLSNNQLGEEKLEQKIQALIDDILMKSINENSSEFNIHQYDNISDMYKNFLKRLNDNLRPLIKQKSLDYLSEKLYKKFSDNLNLRDQQSPPDSNQQTSIKNIKEFEDFLGIGSLTQFLNQEDIKKYAHAYQQTMKLLDSENQEDEDLKKTFREELKKRFRLQLIRRVKLKLPSNNFPKSFEDAKETYINTQGYKVTLKQKDGYSLYEKELNENASLPNFLNNDQLTPDDKEKFKALLNENRDSISNFDEIFFFHYHQKASSIKASYEKRADELKLKFPNKKGQIDTELSRIKGIVDDARKEAFDHIREKFEAALVECLKLPDVIHEDGKIKLDKFNKALDARIKRIKKEGDEIFKQKLIDKDCHIYSAPARENTTAFGGDTLMITKDGNFVVKINSTTTTSHTKNKGPSVSEVTMQDGEDIVYQAYRTSHLASPSSKVEDVEAIIRGFMDRRIDANNPMIYNLLTSVHSSDYSLVGFSDYWTNQQTKRLKILLDAQDKYNDTVTSFADYFFTFNTPTNTFGNEIKLDSRDPLIQRIARSNTIALAIILYGKDHEKVKNLILERNNHDSFMSEYQKLKNIPPPNIEDSKEKRFLFERFKNGDAATHRYAKATATCVGLCTKEGKFNLLVGCKSGLERTGNIIGRIAAYLKFNRTKTEAVAKESNPDKNPNHIAKDIDEIYNTNGVYNSGTCLTSCNDQGGNPKTKTSSGKGMKPNTNATEDGDVLPNMQNKNMSCLQAHKDKKFDESKDCIPSYILWAPKKIFFPLVWMARYREHAQLMAQIDTDLGCAPESNFFLWKKRLQEVQSANSPAAHDAPSDQEHTPPGP